MTPRRIAIEIPAGSQQEPLADSSAEVGGALVRSWSGLHAAVEVGAEAVQNGPWKLTVTIVNATPMEGQDGEEAF
jgi:hypothetical protein